MAEEKDKDSKTELPTETKISNALEKGNVAFSREITNAASLVAAIIVTYLFIPSMITELRGVLRSVFANINNWPLDDPVDAAKLQNLLGAKILFSLAPVILPLVVIGLTSSLSQNMPRMVGNRIQPKLEKISPLKGLKRLLGPQGVREFGKALFKFSAAAIIASIVAFSQTEFVISRIMVDTARIPAIIYDLFLQVLTGLALMMTILGIADYVLVRREWYNGLKMTLQEVKDERKQTEGDPMIKLRTRSIAQDRARRRMISDVAGATLVIANPTHFAVAMRYDPKVDKVPLVLAKGQDRIALKIREIADENQIPITEDPPLARAMYKVVQVNMEIPIEFYLPIARIIRALSKPSMGMVN